MAYVVDASAVVDFSLLSVSSGHALRHLIGTEELLAPNLLVSEVMSAFRRMERAGAFRAGLGDRAVARVGRMPVGFIEDRLLMKEAWRLRGFLRTSDALYVAAARAAKSPLLTTDVRLARAVREQVPDVQVVSV